MDRSEFASSDYVCVELDAEIFEMLQQNHGGWNSTMAGVRIYFKPVYISLVSLSAMCTQYAFDLHGGSFCY